MNGILAFCAATILAASLTACNQTPAPAANANTSNHDADVQAIRDTETRWDQDFASKDPAKIASYYTDDAVFMGPGMQAASGRDAIQKIDADMVKDPAMSLHFQSSKIDVASSGDLAYSRGTYTMTMTNPATKKPMDDHGSYVTDYKKQPDGSWKAVADIVTSEVPMVPAAPMKMKH